MSDLLPLITLPPLMSTYVLTDYTDFLHCRSMTLDQWNTSCVTMVSRMMLLLLSPSPSFRLLASPSLSFPLYLFLPLPPFLLSDYKQDPYSEGNPMNTICSRGDLLETPVDGGCYDTKVHSEFQDILPQLERQK